jgi:hypothetical protein
LNLKLIFNTILVPSSVHLLANVFILKKKKEENCSFNLKLLCLFSATEVTLKIYTVNQSNNIVTYK